MCTVTEKGTPGMQPCRRGFVSHPVMGWISVGLLVVGGLGEAELFSRPAQAPTLVRAVYVTVVGESGFPIQDLGEDDFFVQEDGREREILRAELATDPMQISLLVDTSSAARQIIGDMRRALERFVTELSADHEIALITFGGTRNVRVQPTREQEQLTSGISSLFPHPNTAMYLVNALHDTGTDLRQRDAPRPVIVVVTTTGVDFSDQEPQGAVNQLREVGAPLHAIVMRTSRVQMSFQGTFGLPEFPSWANRARDIILDIGPAQTGGTRVDLSTASGLPEVLSRLVAQLSNQYLVVYASPVNESPPRGVQIGVNRTDSLTLRAVSARLSDAVR